MFEKMETEQKDVYVSAGRIAFIYFLEKRKGGCLRVETEIRNGSGRINWSFLCFISIDRLLR